MKNELFALIRDTDGWNRYSQFVWDLSDKQIDRNIYGMIEHQMQTWGKIDFDVLIGEMECKVAKEPKNTTYVEILHRLQLIQKVDGYNNMHLAVLNTGMVDKLTSVLAGYSMSYPEDIIEQMDKEVSIYVEHRNKLLGRHKQEVVFNSSMLFSSNADSYSWHSDEFNDAFGRLQPGTLVVFGARPETGKTTFLVTLAIHMAIQMATTSKKILWIDNEEPASRVYSRLILRLMNVIKTRTADVTLADIKKRHEKADKAYESTLGGRDRIILLDKADASTRDVERLIAKHDPGLIIFDQLWKVIAPHTKGSNEDVSTQAYLFRWARSLAKQHCPVNFC